MRFPDTIATSSDFVSPKVLRERIISLARQRKITLEGEKLEQWVKTAVDKASRVGRLMTDQQYADYRLGRKFTAGDKVRYVGERREEKAVNGRTTYRPFGQTGAITKATEGQHSLLAVTFTPDTPSELAEGATGDPPLVLLEAQVMTCGWPLLERIPGEGESVA